MTPLVLVHGFMGGAAQWADQVAALSPDRPALAVDLPGFGARADAPPVDSIAGFAEAALADMDAAGLERVALLGHSMGGMVVQEMAARAPRRVARLILYGTGPSGALPNRFETFAVSRARAAQEGAEAAARRMSAAWFLDGEASPAWPACADLAARSGLPAILAGLSAMEAWRGTGALNRVACPSLVLWGDGDRSYGWSETEALWRGVPGARLAVMPGCGHAAHAEAPALFTALLDRFLRR